MPIARVFDPDGAQIGEHARPNMNRALLSAKGAQIYHRRLTEVDFELVHSYKPGTRVVVHETTHTWDGSLWVDMATGLPAEPIAPDTLFTIDGKPHIYKVTIGARVGSSTGSWVPVESPARPKKGST